MDQYIINRMDLKERAKAKINIKAAFLVVLIIYLIPSMVSNLGLFTNIETVEAEGLIYAIQVPNALGVLFSMIIPFILEYWSSAYFIYVSKQDGDVMSSHEFLSTLKFKGFLQYMLKILVANILIFLWSLLFVIPGLIKMYSYYLVPYIAAEHPELSVMETIKESSRLMRGIKSQAFVLDVSFIGWNILSSMTLGIIGFWLMPYYTLTKINLYHDLLQLHNMNSDVIDAEIV